MKLAFLVFALLVSSCGKQRGGPPINYPGSAEEAEASESCAPRAEVELTRAVYQGALKEAYFMGCLEKNKHANERCTDEANEYVESLEI